MACGWLISSYKCLLQFFYANTSTADSCCAFFAFGVSGEVSLLTIMWHPHHARLTHCRMFQQSCWVGAASPAVYPDLAPYQLEVGLDYINNSLALNLTADEVCKLLRSMQLDVTPSAAEANGSTQLLVRVPPTRSDILHACDVMEDVAIAYGYNNLVKQVRWFV